MSPTPLRGGRHNQPWVSDDDLDYDGGNCINSKVMGQVHKDLNTKSFLKRGITVK